MKIAILGLGSIGMRHVRNLLEMGETDLFGYDPRIGEPGFSCAPIQGTNSLDMIWDWKPEAVLICTPPSTHDSLIRAAYFRAIPVFCEKPLSDNALGAENLARQWGEPGNILAVGYQLRWQLQDFRRDAFAEQNCYWSCQDMSVWPSQYQKDVLEEFSHEIDAAVWVNGPVSHLSALQPDPFVWKIQLRHATASSRIVIDTRPGIAYEREAISASGDVAWTFDAELNQQAYRDELKTFLEVCKGAPWDDRLCTGMQAAHVVRIIEACRQSAKNCEVVEL